MGGGRVGVGPWVVMAACGGDGATDTGTDETLCGGQGTAAVEVGTGGLSGFTAWVDGDTVAIVDDGSGTYGFFVDLLTEGVDTTSAATVLLRFSVGDDPTTEDLGASLTFQCPTEGPGWAGVFAALDEAMQDSATVAGLEGLTLGLTALVTDTDGETGEVSVDLVIDAP